MQEDITGTLREIGHDAGICGLCGYPYPVPALASREASPADGTRSAREDVCSACGRSLAEGDDPAFPVEDDLRV